MTSEELAKIVEEGILKLDLEWPLADSIYELRIPRNVRYPNETEPRQVINTQEYLDFLHLNLFPLIDQLEEDAGIKYWHILNHENLDLRLSIQDERQKKEVEKILTKHVITPKSLTKWGTYNDPGLGSRLGCQALLLLYNAQSKFVQNIVRSIYWLSEKYNQKEILSLVSNMLYGVPIYTSHMLLNIFHIFPCDPFYEVIAHLNEGEYRLRGLLEQGSVPQEVVTILETFQNANQELKRLMGFR